MKSKEEIQEPQEAKQISVAQIGMLFLSVYVLVALIIQKCIPLSSQMNQLLDRLDLVVCIAFLADVVYRFFKAPSKLAFIKWGWIDVISSIPMVDFLRWGRLIRILRIIRMFRAFRSVKNLVTFLYKNRAQGTLITVVLISFVMLILAHRVFEWVTPTC